MPIPIAQQVVVITGASSGIGRETALRMARRGASVVLAARSERALQVVADDARALGGRAHVVVTDVTDPRQVEHLADEAVRAFGRIDTWINDAAVSEYATFEQMTEDEFRRIVDVNLMGPVYGTRAALRHMRRQGGGTIINIGSVLSERAVPLQSAYVASKHALRGFTDAVRMELAREDIGVNITLILPSSINTPLFDHARSRMQSKPRPIGTVYEPAVVADAIIFAAGHRVRELYAGGYGKAISVLNKRSPRLIDWYRTQGARAFRQQQDRRANDGVDTLLKPGSSTGSVRGRFGRRAAWRSLYTRFVEPHPLLRGAVIGAIALGAATVLVAVGRATRRATNGKSSTLRIQRPARDPRLEIIRDAYRPIIKGLHDVGIKATDLPGFDRLHAEFLRCLEAARDEVDPQPHSRRELRVPPTPPPRSAPRQVIRSA